MRWLIFVVHQMPHFYCSGDPSLLLLIGSLIFVGRQIAPFYRSLDRSFLLFITSLMFFVHQMTHFYRSFLSFLGSLIFIVHQIASFYHSLDCSFYRHLIAHFYRSIYRLFLSFTRSLIFIVHYITHVYRSLDCSFLSSIETAFEEVLLPTCSHSMGSYVVWCDMVVRGYHLFHWGSFFSFSFFSWRVNFFLPLFLSVCLFSCLNFDGATAVQVKPCLVLVYLPTSVFFLLVYLLISFLYVFVVV